MWGDQGIDDCNENETTFAPSRRSEEAEESGQVKMNPCKA